MSRVLPILFNTEMVRAILDDRKMVTRRVIKPANPFRNKEGYCQGNGLWIDGYSKNDEPNGHIKDYSVSSCWMRKKYYIEKYAPYQKGDILYVRETWFKDVERYMYRADYSSEEKFYKNGKEIVMKWRPSIHMPKEAARIWLKVTDVRVERLQEITGTGILAEGVDNGKSNPAMGKRWENMQRITFENLWNSTIKKSDFARYGWDANPWVWVIDFERCEKPEN